jgi:hypothetical protein
MHPSENFSADKKIRTLIDGAEETVSLWRVAVTQRTRSQNVLPDRAGAVLA